MPGPHSIVGISFVKIHIGIYLYGILLKKPLIYNSSVRLP